MIGESLIDSNKEMTWVCVLDHSGNYMADEGAGSSFRSEAERSVKHFNSLSVIQMWHCPYCKPHEPWIPQWHLSEITPLTSWLQNFYIKIHVVSERGHNIHHLLEKSALDISIQSLIGSHTVSGRFFSTLPSPSSQLTLMSLSIS